MLTDYLCISDLVYTKRKAGKNVVNYNHNDDCLIKSNAINILTLMK